MCVTVSKVGQLRPAKKQGMQRCNTSTILPNMNVLAEVIGVTEP